MGLLALLLASLTACVAAQYVTVETNEGTLRGVATTTVNGTAYYRFSGVPFAAPPLGELRFKPPQPHPGWEGVRDALEEGSDCLQVLPEGASGAEDCLYLNVYTTSLSEDSQLPVMVWIYGGAFITGSGSARSYGPDFLVEQGVILVTLNYRLGVMGLLGLDDPVAAGNNAFKDQAAAMRWVQANIRAMGGDPDKVTIFGQSAGGSSVELHVYSALSRGLFRAAISQSGSAIGGGQGETNNRETALCIGAELGLQTENSTELLAFLQSVDALSLYNTSCGTGFGMAVEPEGEGAFLTTGTGHLGAWALAGNYTHVPLVSGVTSGEYNFMVGGDVLDEVTVNQLNNDFEGAIDFQLRLPDAESKQAAAEVIRRFYFGNVSSITADDAVPYAAMMTDLNNGEPADTTVHLISSSNTYPVFYYQYDYSGSSQDLGLPGAPHMADLDSLFKTAGPGQNLDPASDEQKVRNVMVKLWTNFAKYMNPTPEDDPVIEGGWPRFNSTTQYYLNINVNTTLEQHRMGERMDFLHSVIPPYY
ncbi:esterase FE4-like [Schistocerca nitens]|uniref:esterase FE4-like n=1 Tax=Schistocerca nitens TaxID=7011 RepID=UPI00211883D2|nr:esterase FE4-like [Schistocerca nitens]